MEFRTEHDLLGTIQLPKESLTGIHTARASQNFFIAARPVHESLLRAFGAVKAACARTNTELGYLTPELGGAIESACSELMSGSLHEYLTLDALQGGAGTSTNMAVNELIANRALQLLGHQPGRYDLLSPIDHVNMHQSTNDTYPTALRVAAIWQLRRLEGAVVQLLEAFQRKEQEFSDVVKVGRTQLQDAVLTTLGREMGAYADALGRDRWRISKCEERLRVVNLGGTAIGTGLGAPRKYIFRATDNLRAVTSIGLARAENLVEATQNLDALVEVSGILKALASTLLKITGDLRLLSSGPEAGLAEITLPPVQAGSSLMPGKVNPVIPEAVAQAALKVMANDSTIGIAAGMGNLELNAFMPLIADALLESIGVLERSCVTLATRCVDGMAANRQRCAAWARNGTALVTALVEEFGYQMAQELSQEATQTGKGLADLVVERGMLTSRQFEELISPERVMRLGSTRSPNEQPKVDKK